jgi:ABC-type dipeptide/oligopeptide/nickel transport system permease component
LSYRRFFLIRLAQALFAIWLVATLVFVMFFVLLPKPARNLAGGNQATPAMIGRISAELHLDAPLNEQYGVHVAGLRTPERREID